jgi:hypothetical protein
VIEQIVIENKSFGLDAPYYKALGNSDQDHKGCETECTPCDGDCKCSSGMEAMLLGYLKKQVLANIQ